MPELLRAARGFSGRSGLVRAGPGRAEECCRGADDGRPPAGPLNAIDSPTVLCEGERMRIPRTGGRRTAKRKPRQAARTAVLAPGGEVFLLRSDNSEVGVHWT